MIRSNHCAGRSPRPARVPRSGLFGLLLCLAVEPPGPVFAGEFPRPQPAEAAGPVEATVFQPRAESDLAALEAVVRERSAALQEEHLAVELEVAELQKSRLFENPVLEGSVGTIPLGQPNPPDLMEPLANIPNYSIGLSLHPDLLRRRSRIQQAESELVAATERRRFAVRGQALRLLRALGDMATATLRYGADQHLLLQARGALLVARERVRTGFGPPLDGDRAEIELMRLEQQVAADQAEILAAQAACAAPVGSRCAGFPDEAEARRFLDTWLRRGAATGPDRPGEPVALYQRPDLLALMAQHDAASAEERVARAQRLPDPTVRVGYTYDTFVVSGNQRHSLNVGLSLPLALFDRGQAEAMAARAKQHRLHEQRRLTLAGAEAKVTVLRQALLVGQQRLSALQQQVLPRVQAILRNVGRAFEARAVPLTDVIQAQRGLGELLREEAATLGETFRVTVDLIEERGGA